MGRRPGDALAGANLQRQGFTTESRQKSAATKRAKKDGAAVALALISDATYRKNLKKRLRDGTAGPIENLLWLLAYGKPREQTTGEDIQARITEVREAAKKAIRASTPRRRIPADVVEGALVKVTEEGGNGQP